MDAETFRDLFERHVVAPAASVGFVPWGRSLWLEDGDFCAAVLRTESYNLWPFELTLVLGHTYLRDFDDQPLHRSRNPSEYPVKLRPSDARRAARRFRYEPHNLGRWPADEMVEGRVDRQLREIGKALVRGVPRLRDLLTPPVLIAQLERHGEDAWAERRWKEDYAARVGAG